MLKKGTRWSFLIGRQEIKRKKLKKKSPNHRPFGEEDNLNTHGAQGIDCCNVDIGKKVLSFLEEIKKRQQKIKGEKEE